MEFSMKWRWDRAYNVANGFLRLKAALFLFFIYFFCLDPPPRMIHSSQNLKRIYETKILSPYVGL